MREGQPVLIVEDERLVARDLQRTLLGFGYDAFAIAASAQEALARAQERCPAVVLMDIRIQGELDGIETAKLLRERYSSAVVYLTAHADSDTIERATATSPHGYLQKPVRPAELRSAIEISLHKRKAEVRWEEGERWVDSALAGSHEAVVALSDAGLVVEASRAFCDWLGAPASALRGKPFRELAALHSAAGDDAPAVEQDLSALRDGVPRTGDGALWTAGVWRLVRFRAQPVWSGARRLGVLLSLLERPAEPATRCALTSDEDIERERRAQPSPLVHAQPERSQELPRIAFGPYAEALIRGVLRSHGALGGGIEYGVLGAELSLSVEQAVPCGLILNELVSNASKHAFPAGRPGTIRVELARVDQQLSLCVRDDGVGLPESRDPRDAASPGLNRVFTFAEQLAAKVEWQGATGTAFTFRFSEK